MAAGAATETQPAPGFPTETGRHVGRYTLLAKLASGGMAEIFLARQQGVQGFEKLVVVKRILTSFSEDPEFVTMFLEEGRLAGQLSHPNVVQTFDLGEDHGTYFIAMEYIAGESLAMVARQARIKGRAVDIRIAARLISQAAEGLDYAHRKTDILGKPLHIVHRDISPQNLLVTYDGMMKVVDFGIARASNRASHTAQGQVRGKLSYMAPEQMTEGAIIDSRSDLFSLGVVLFEMVTGTRLVEGGDPARAVNVICGTGPMPTAVSRRPDVDPRLNAIIAKSMSRDPEQRFQSGGDLHRSLEQWLGSVGMMGAAEVSEFMRDLFAERLADRQQLIEKALRGDLDTSAQVAQAEVPSDHSMPDRSNKTLLRYAAVAKRWRGISAAAVGVAILAAAGWYLHLPRVTVAQPSVVVGVQVPAPVADAKPPPTASVRPTIQVSTPVSLGTAAPAPVVAPAPVAAPPVTAPPAPAPAPTGAETTPPVAVDPPKPRGHSHEKHAGTVAHGGKLTLDTTPWTEVFWKGKDLGQTPLFEVDLPAGTQRLVLKNAVDSVDQTIEVEIPIGKVVVQKLHL